MHLCAGCGHSNRPEAWFCTHCDRPILASDAMEAPAPTSIVAIVVLAVGLLVFLTIRPMTPDEANERSAPALQTVDPVVETPAAPLPVRPATLVDPAPPAAPALHPVIRAPEEGGPAVGTSDGRPLSSSSFVA